MSPSSVTSMRPIFCRPLRECLDIRPRSLINYLRYYIHDRLDDLWFSPSKTPR